MMVFNGSFCYHKSWSPPSAVILKCHHETWGGSIVMWLPLYRWLVVCLFCLENHRKMWMIFSGTHGSTLILGNFHIYAAMRCDCIEVYFWNGRSTEIRSITWRASRVTKEYEMQRYWTFSERHWLEARSSSSIWMERGRNGTAVEALPEEAKRLI